MSIYTIRVGRGTEYWYSDHCPAVGERFTREGREYVVTKVSDEGHELVVVTVEDAVRGSASTARRPAARRPSPGLPSGDPGEAADGSRRGAQLPG